MSWAWWRRWAVFNPRIIRYLMIPTTQIWPEKIFVAFSDLLSYKVANEKIMPSILKQNNKRSMVAIQNVLHKYIERRMLHVSKQAPPPTWMFLGSPKGKNMRNKLFFWVFKTGKNDCDAAPSNEIISHSKLNWSQLLIVFIEPLINNKLQQIGFGQARLILDLFN